LIHLLFGDFVGARRLRSLRARLGDDSAVALNMAVFEASHATLAEVTAACDAIPFLAERRLVILRGFLARLSSSRGLDVGWIEQRLMHLPDFVDVVLLEESTPEESGLALQKQLESEGRLLCERDAALDAVGAMAFVLEVARERGWDIAPQVAEALVDATGLDRGALEREIEKLDLYRRVATIDRDALEVLVARQEAGRDWEFVRALGERDARRTLAEWRRLTDRGDDPHHLLSRMGRQVRQIAQASDVLRHGGAGDVARTLGVSPGVAGAISAQARRWSPVEARRLFAALVEADHLGKTGGAPLDHALPCLIATFGQADRPTSASTVGSRATTRG